MTRPIFRPICKLTAVAGIAAAIEKEGNENEPQPWSPLADAAAAATVLLSIVFHPASCFPFSQFVPLFSFLLFHWFQYFQLFHCSCLLLCAMCHFSLLCGARKQLWELKLKQKHPTFADSFHLSRHCLSWHCLLTKRRTSYQRKPILKLAFTTSTIALIHPFEQLDQ